MLIEPKCFKPKDVPVDDIEKSLTIAAPLNKVWAALTDPVALGEWMADDSVEVDLRMDGIYSLFGGETTGHFTYIKAPRILEYTWRQGEWPREWADSIVRWELEPAGVDTRVHLLHKNFPNDEERVSHDDGWVSYWLEPMQEWLEDS
jgi:uncharacterized protein YndB with AHSA1/START domain